MRRTAPALDSIWVPRPEFAQGAMRVELDQPAVRNKQQQQLFSLTDHEKEQYADEPYVGVDHLYEAHEGSKDKPVIVEMIGVHGNDLITGCLGGCHKDAADAVIYYTTVPPNTLAVCLDCGIHFVARCNEQLTFWPDGTQPWEKVDFKVVEGSLHKHYKYGSPLMI